MATAATISARLVLDSSAYNKGLDDAVNKAKSFGNDLTSHLSQVGGSIFGIVGKVGGFIGDTFIAAAKIATGALVGLGAATVAFGVQAFTAAARVDELRVIDEILAKNAGLSADAVNKVALAIKAQGIESAVAYDSVAQMIRAHLDLSKAADLARVAQDAAVISGQNSTDAYNQTILGITKLNTEILRNAGFVVDATTAYNNYAKQMHVSVGSLTEAQKQAAFLNEVLKQGKTIAGAYAAAMEEPGKVLRSFPRYINDILVSAGEPLTIVFGKSVMALAGFLKALGKAVDVGGALHPVIVRLADALDPMVNLFVKWLTDFDFTALANGLMNIVDWLAINLPRAIDFMLIAWNQYLLPAFQTLGNFISTVFWPIVQQVFGWLVVNVPLAWGWLMDNKGLLVGIFVDLGVAMAAFGVTSIATALTALVPWLPAIAIMALIAGAAWLMYNAWTQDWSGIREKAADAWDAIKPKLDEMKTWLDTNIPIAIAILKLKWGELQNSIAIASQWIKDNIFPVFTDMKLWLDTNIPIAIAKLNLKWGELQNQMAMLEAWYNEHLKPLFSELGNTVGFLLPLYFQNWQNRIKILSLIIQFLGGVISTLINDNLYTLQAVIKAVGDFIDGQFNSSLNALNGFIDAVTQAVHDLNTALGELKLPTWLTPGSPTPWELGLVGINKAMDQLSGKALPNLRANLNLNPVGMDGGANFAANVGGGGGNNGGSDMGQVVYWLQQIAAKKELDEVKLAQAGRDIDLRRAR